MKCFPYQLQKIILWGTSLTDGYITSSAQIVLCLLGCHRIHIRRYPRPILSCICIKVSKSSNHSIISHMSTVDTVYTRKSNTVDLVIFACLNFHDFQILGLFPNFGIREFSLFSNSAFIIIIFPRFLNREFVLFANITRSTDHNLGLHGLGLLCEQEITNISYWGWRQAEVI